MIYSIARVILLWRNITQFRVHGQRKVYTNHSLKDCMVVGNLSNHRGGCHFKKKAHK